MRAVARREARCVAGVHRAVQRNPLTVATLLRSLLKAQPRVTAGDLRALLDSASGDAAAWKKAELEPFIFSRQLTLEARYLLLQHLKRQR